MAPNHTEVFTQAIPPGEPEAFEKRINLILYPRREFVNRTEDILYPCSKEQVADYSLFVDGEACFGSDEFRRACCARELFRHLIMANKKYGLPVNDADLEQAFRAFTGSSQRYIDPDSIERQTILEAVHEANDILISIRPRWNPPKNPLPEKPQDPTPPIPPQAADNNTQSARRQLPNPVAPETRATAETAETVTTLRHSTRVSKVATEPVPVRPRILYLLLPSPAGKANEISPLRGRRIRSQNFQRY